LSESYAAATFDSKDAGAGKAVSVTGIALAGADAGNYTFNATAGATADITPRALAVSATADGKAYDGTTAAVAHLTDDRVAGDALSESYASANFDSKDAGAGKAVSVTGIALAGADAGNYTFNSAAGATADVARRALTVSATAD